MVWNVHERDVDKLEVDLGTLVQKFQEGTRIKVRALHLVRVIGATYEAPERFSLEIELEDEQP